MSAANWVTRMGMMKNLSTTLASYNIAVNDVAPVSETT